MTRRILSVLAASLIASAAPVGAASAQTVQASPAAPDPKLPPMPSMEGQQGDDGKPMSAVPRKTVTSPHKASKPRSSGAKAKATPTKRRR